ncbi:MAG: hypothetical protein AAGJ68_00860 [Pseudomonadota bacterium]
MSGKKKSSDPVQNAIASLEDRVNVIGRAVFGSENFGKIMNTAVSTQGRMQKGFSDRMARNLHFYNMPSQDDVVALAEQCARIEERMVAIENMLLVLVEDKMPAARTGPARTRKPKSKSKPKAPPS